MAMDPALALEVATLKRQRCLEDAIGSGTSDVQRFYEGATVFVTGGTGFLGKQLIEKLLRSCPNIKRIYVLTRPKKDKTPTERVAEITSEPLYDSVRKVYPRFFEKITVMEGDITQLNLGLSTKDRESFVEEVNIIFHLAATTRFDEPLRSAVLTNVRSTREVLTLAAACTHLAALLHVSTAFSNCPLSKVDEKFYPPPVPYDVMIDLVESTDDARLDSITPSLIKPWPNTYAFTKAIAEDAVRQLSVNIPAAVLRPAIVVATYNEPSPGWLDMSSVYGPSGVILGSGLGVLHSFLADLKCKLDLVPADFVNNACIVAARRAALEYRAGNTDTKVYTYSSGKRNPLTWGDVVHLCNNYCRWMISPSAVWYCFSTLQSNRLLHALLSFVWHTVPAVVVDGAAVAIGKKPRFRKLYGKIDKLNEVVAYFSHNQWEFDDKNTSELYEELSAVDKQIYRFDITNLDWKEYIQIWYLGIRKYIIKDGLKNTEYGAKKQFIFRICHYLVISLYFYILWNIVNLFYRIVRMIY